MITIKASEFKAKCLKMMDTISQTGEAIIITKNGKPIAKMLPYSPPKGELFGFLRGQITYVDDSVFDSPMLEAWEHWDEERNLK